MAVDTETGRKISIVRIAQILFYESDEEHPLSQQQILARLQEKYGLEMDRKAVRRNLMALRDNGLPVECREVDRVIRGREAPLSLDWYWKHEMTKADIQTLIDLLYFSHLPTLQVKQISEKLKRLHRQGFNDGKSGVRNIPAVQRPVPPQDTLSVLSDAIGKKKQVQFFYDHYEADGKKHHGRMSDGKDRSYVVNPYVVAASDGRYFLLGSIDDKEEITAFAVELIAEAKMTDREVRPQKTIRGAETGIRTSDFLATVSRTYLGAPEVCRFDADWHLMTDIITDFGKSAFLVSATQGRVLVEVNAPPAVVRAWVLKNAPLVKVVSPVSLVKSVRDAAADLTRLYGGG